MGFLGRHGATEERRSLWPARSWGLRLRVMKTWEEVVGQAQQEPQEDHGVQVVLVDAVGVPLVDQFVEGFVLDAPAAVSDVHDRVGRGPLEWTSLAGLERSARSRAGNRVCQVSPERLGVYFSATICGARTSRKPTMP